MSKLFSRVSLTADNGSTDEYLCPGMPDTEEQIADTDGYRDFIEDNPDAESVTVDVEHYIYGEGDVFKGDADRRQRQRRHASLFGFSEGSLRFGGLDDLSEIHVGQPRQQIRQSRGRYLPLWRRRCLYRQHLRGRCVHRQRRTISFASRRALAGQLGVYGLSSCYESAKTCGQSRVYLI